MTFDAREKSVDDGKPIELVEIVYSGRAWRLTNVEVPQIKDGVEYKPLTMSRTEIEPTADIAKANITLSVPMTSDIGDVFKVQPPSEVVRMTVYARHDLDNEFQVIWKGRVINAEFEPPWLKLTSDSVFSSLKRTGVRRRYSAQCPYALYGAKCGVSRALFKRTFTLTSMSGSTVTFNEAAADADGFYAGGYIQYANAEHGNIETRMIRESFTGTGLMKLSTPPLGLAPGMEVDLFPGCDHTDGPNGCGKFSNEINFGGFKFIPRKNPFGGTMLY